MKLTPFFLLFFLFLTGCASSLPEPKLDPPVDYDAVLVSERGLFLYWTQEQQKEVLKAADRFVEERQHHQYQTTYRWQGATLREIVRMGSREQQKTLQEYRLHLRFNQEGEAIYQQYRIADKVAPLTKSQMQFYFQQAMQVAPKVQEKVAEKQQWRQGWWDGKAFSVCDGKSNSVVLMPKAKAQLEQLAWHTFPVYVIWEGERQVNQFQATQLLWWSYEPKDCLAQPELIEQ